MQMPATRHGRRLKTRKTRRWIRVRGGGEDDPFYAWAKTQKMPPAPAFVRVMESALTRGVQKFGLKQEVADVLLQSYKDRDTTLDMQAYFEEVLVKFGELDRDSAKRIVVG